VLQGRGGEEWGIDLAQALEASLVGSPAAGNAGLRPTAGRYFTLNRQALTGCHSPCIQLA